jgi:hypothetical protein
MTLYVALVVVGLVAALAWQAGYRHGKTDEHDRIWAEHGSKLAPKRDDA